jgi:hypothetical protein
MVWCSKLLLPGTTTGHSNSVTDGRRSFFFREIVVHLLQLKCCVEQGFQPHMAIELMIDQSKSRSINQSIHQHEIEPIHSSQKGPSPMRAPLPSITAFLSLLLSCTTMKVAAAAPDQGRTPASSPQPALRATPSSDAQSHPQPLNDGSDSSFDYIVVGAGNAGAVVAARWVGWFVYEMTTLLN